MNQNEKEGQSAGRTTGESGINAEQQQHRTIEGQESQPGKVWQEQDQRYGSESGQSGSGVRGGTGGESSGRNPQGQYSGHGDTNVGGSDPDVRRDTKDEQPENEQLDEGQWQGNRFGQGGFGNQGRSG